MPSLSTIMSLSASGYAVVLDEAMPAIECLIARNEHYSAPDWDSLEFYAKNYQLCDCVYH